MNEDATPPPDKSVNENLPAAPSEKGVTKPPEQEGQPKAEVIPNTQDMPPQVMRQFQSFMAMFQSQVRTSEHPLFSKFTAEHIDKYLDGIQKDDDFEHQLEASNRWFYLAYVVLAVIILALAIVYLLPRDRDLLVTLLQILVVLAGGIGAGYGLSKRGK